MITILLNSLLSFLRVLNQILSAGIAITAFALLLYALTFNLRDRIARSFAQILICVVIVFTTDAIGSTAQTDLEIEFWFHIQWIGIIGLPITYYQFSHALLVTTGASNSGWRKWLAWILFFISFLFLLSLPYSALVGAVIIDQAPAPYLQPTLLTYFFVAYYFFVMIITWINFKTAYNRTTTPTSHRRMSYLIIGALAPALGSFPYLLFGSSFAAQHSLIFWIISVISNIFVGVLIVIMAYTVAFFGVSWPDRIVRSRLFKWIMRGPVTAIITLAVVTIIRRIGEKIGFNYSILVPITMVCCILLLEFIITVFGTIWQKWLFYANDREDLEVLTNLENHLLSRNDLSQFLEMILAAVCDRLQVKGAYIAAINNNDIELVVEVGEKINEFSSYGNDLYKIISQNDTKPEIFQWGSDCLLLLFEKKDTGDLKLLGILGISNLNGSDITDEQRKALSLLTQRAILALSDRLTQEKVLQSLHSLTPQMEIFQHIRAATRFNRNNLLEEKVPSISEDMVVWIKDALGHYWGGPKLTKSPLMQLIVVQNAFQAHNGNHPNALRSILREGIERVRPEGERRFTGEWLLYNILEMKFLEGKKVREIAIRLAMSEADLYRKQRIAIEAVTKEIIKMESQAQVSLEKNGVSRNFHEIQM